MVRPQARFRDCSINVEVDKALPLVCIHSGRLEQVLLNLLMNAADAVGPGGNVWVRSEVRGKMLVLFVEDDGEGIEEQERSRIFQPFVTTKEKGTGTGLGLFVCQHLITAYGGEILASNREEGGARFEFSLWFEDEDSAEEKHEAEG